MSIVPKKNKLKRHHQYRARPARQFSMLGHPKKYGKIRVIIFDDANLLQSSMHVRRIVDSADCCATEYKKFAYITLSKPLTAAEDAISSGLSTDFFEAIGIKRGEHCH